MLVEFVFVLIFLFPPLYLSSPFSAHLCDLYESDCIFDKFECAISGDASHVATGSYNNVFHIHDRQGLIGGSSTEVGGISYI